MRKIKIGRRTGSFAESDRFVRIAYKIIAVEPAVNYMPLDQLNRLIHEFDRPYLTVEEVAREAVRALHGEDAAQEMLRLLLPLQPIIPHGLTTEQLIQLMEEIQQEYPALQPEGVVAEVARRLLGEGRSALGGFNDSPVTYLCPRCGGSGKIVSRLHTNCFCRNIPVPEGAAPGTAFTHEGRDYSFRGKCRLCKGAGHVPANLRYGPIEPKPCWAHRGFRQTTEGWVPRRGSDGECFPDDDVEEY